MLLRAYFVADISRKRLGFTRARCELPNGRIVEVQGRRTPLYDLARRLDELGFGDWQLQAYTPTGVPSFRGKVSTMAELTVEESDKRGLRLRKFRPMTVGGVAKDEREGSDGSEPRVEVEMPLSDPPSRDEVA